MRLPDHDVLAVLCTPLLSERGIDRIEQLARDVVGRVQDFSSVCDVTSEQRGCDSKEAKAWIHGSNA